MIKNKNLIGISGKKRSGKDTFYNVLFQCCPQYECKKFADNLKEICSILTGKPISYFYNHYYYDTKLEEWGLNIREIQQKVGTEIFRNNFDKDVWIKSLFSEYSPAFSKWVITDVRFPNEAEAIKNKGGILIRINRPELANDDKHDSETSLDDYQDWDYVITNDGTLDEYGEKIIEIVKALNI